MDTPEVLRCLDGMRRDHIFDIRFSGGEATTRLNWFKEIRYARDIGLAVSLNTNGVYKDPETVDKLADLEIDQITVSIDGTEEHHNTNRGKGTYQKAMRTLEALHKWGVALRTNTVLTSLSIEDAEDVIRNAGPYVEEMAFFHMRMTGRARGIKERMVGFAELHQFKLKMDELKKIYPDIRFYFGERAIQENSIMPNDLGLQIGSPDGLTRLNLLADGSLYAGGYTAYIDPSWKLGNLQNEGYSLLNIWRNSQVLENYRNFGKEFLERCLRCPELDKRCPGVNVEMELIRKSLPEIGNPNCIY